MSHVYLRDRIWRVENQQVLTDQRVFLQLREPTTGESGEALCPPDTVTWLADGAPALESRAFIPAGRWLEQTAALRLGDSTTVPFAALAAGRISPEPYQFAPAARLLALPRPSLLIADDVGLGKTVEAGICLLELIARGRGRRVLLVVPPGLIPQWRDEMREKFGLEFQCVENAASLDRLQMSLAEGLKPWVFFDRLITSVEFLKKRDVWAQALQPHWDVIVVDEAHYIAESGTPRTPYATQRTRLGQRLREAAHSLLLLTATPHNGYSHSFRSLLELVEPTDATFAGDRESVRRRMARSMIRRLKPQIWRTDANGHPGPAFQLREPVQAIPVRVLGTDERRVFQLVSSYCARNVRAAEGTDDADLVSFAMQIVKKRMLSSRVALTNTVTARLEALGSRVDTEEPPSRADLRELQSDLPVSEATQERIARRVIRAAVPSDTRRKNEERRRLREIKALLDAAATQPDPKFVALCDDLRRDVLPAPGEKAIIFTEYLDTLNALHACFESTPDLAGQAVMLTGGMTSRRRLEVLNQFAQPEVRFLLATDAASEGLNLQRFCRRVYHVELPWNPNRLEQRNGRVDRHGQTRHPIIRYLFYPDSPEDRVLDRLVQRIVQMQEDRVSTPDILGILAETRIDAALTQIDAAAADPDAESRNLFQIFEERRAEFTAEVAPLLVASGRPEVTGLDPESLCADSLVGDDETAESVLVARLGAALRPHALAGAFALRTPRELLGPGVAENYSCLTFRRSVAINRPADEVEFVHRYHPLALAVIEEAFRRVTFNPASLADGPAGERFAVRRHSAAGNAPFAVFTFLSSEHTPRGDFVAVAVSASGQALDDLCTAAAFDRQTALGEVPWTEVERAFAAGFGALQTAAKAAAETTIALRLAQQHANRHATASLLREDAARYRTDRLEEIAREEQAARTAEERAGQFMLFEQREVSGFAAKRAAVETFHRRRLEDVARFEAPPIPPPLHPLGVMFVFPA